MAEHSYDTPPTNLRSLEQRLQNIADDEVLRIRARRQIGYMAVIAALRNNAVDRGGQPLFTIKGGVAIELLLGMQARATKDLDAAVRAAEGEIEPQLQDALAEGWDGFTFRLVSWEPIRETRAHRGDIKVSYKGRPFSTVQFEAAPAEGEAGQELEFARNTFLDPASLGLTPVEDVPIVTLAYLLAQKLHACTDHSDEDRPNDRARDLIDILLVRRLLKKEEFSEVRRACVEIFRLRGKHDWPPSITVLQDWPALYVTEHRKTPDFEPSDVEEAAALVHSFIAEIDESAG